jgi:hypothetical protein
MISDGPQTKHHKQFQISISAGSLHVTVACVFLLLSSVRT